MPDALAHVFGLRRVRTLPGDVESDSDGLVSQGLEGRWVGDGRLVMIWFVPVSSFGLSGLMRIAQWEEMKNFISAEPSAFQKL